MCHLPGGSFIIVFQVASLTYEWVQLDNTVQYMHYNPVYNNLLIIRLLRFQAGDVHARGAELSETLDVRDLGVGLHPAAIVSDRLRPTHPRERADAPDVRRHGLRRLRRRCHDVVRRRSERRQRSRHQDQNLALESGFRICVRLGQEGPGSGDLNSSFIFMSYACDERLC